MPRGERLAGWFLPTFGGLLAVAAYLFTLFLRAGSLFGGDGDVGRHIRVGSDILLTRSIPRVDVYSHTMAGEHFVPYEWLSEVIFAWVHQVGGLPGVAVLTGLLFTAAVVAVYLTIVRWGVPSFLAFVFGFAAFLLLSSHLLPRPHLFTTLLVAVFALVLHDVRRGAGPRRLLVLPLLMLLWANAHGGFLLGFIVLFLFGAEAAWLRWREADPRAATTLRWIGLTLLLCLAASMATPAGLELWPHTTGYLRLDYLVDTTQEYRSPDFHGGLGRVFLIVLLYGVCVLAWVRSRIEPLGLVAYVLFVAFALHSARNIPIFAVLCVPWMAVWTHGILTQAETRSRSQRFLEWSERLEIVTRRLPGWPFVAVAFAVLTFLALRSEHATLYRWDADRYPVAAVAQLDRIRGGGPVFNQFEWGGYLLYAAWPEVPVFIDGQTDFYGEKLAKEYHAIRQVQPGWQALLDEHRIAWALIPPDAPLASALELHAGWERVYADSTAVAFVRGAGADAPAGSSTR